EEGYSELINKQIKSDTLFATISFQSLDQNQTSMSGLLEVEALEDFPLGCKLYISLIEDDIIFSGSAGPNGQKHFEVVLRSFYPDAHGLDINLVKGDKLPINFNFTLKAEWGDDLTVIAFVQNSADKSVLQSGWTRYPPF
ncbi:MAG: hypothetical protein KAJ16_09255, partial [Calditrichia bacterium]|nr:hypothetical protein [Calditrichia bacterium]